jgi:hypothetical protein
MDQMANVVTFLPPFNPVQWVMQADAAGLIMYFNPAGELTPHIAPQHDRDQIMRLARLADATPDGWDMIADVLHEALFGEDAAC